MPQHATRVPRDLLSGDHEVETGSHRDELVVEEHSDEVFGVDELAEQVGGGQRGAAWQVDFGEDF